MDADDKDELVSIILSVIFTLSLMCICATCVYLIYLRGKCVEKERERHFGRVPNPHNVV